MNKVSKYQSPNSTKNLFDSLLDEFFNREIGTFIGSDSGFHNVPVNVLESENDFSIELAVPGYDKDNFELKVEDDALTISARKETKEDASNGKFTRREFQVSSFSRTFNLPDSVNPNEVSAVYDAGVLKITLPKNEEAKPVVRNIQVG